LLGVEVILVVLELLELLVVLVVRLVQEVRLALLVPLLQEVLLVLVDQVVVLVELQATLPPKVGAERCNSSFYSGESLFVFLYTRK